MKLPRQIKEYFYNEERMRSDVQLARDFGSFPPSPLNCSGLDEEFTIVRTRNVGGLFVSLLMFKRLLRVRHLDEISPSLHVTWCEMQAMRSQFTGGITQFRNSIKTPIECVFFVLVITPLLFIVSLVMMPWALLKVTSVLFNAYRKLPRGLGYFAPLFTKADQIVIKADLLAKRIDIDSIIAHEHIHLLQHRGGQIDDKQSNCAYVLFGAAWKKDAYLLYILEKNELEARLHEVVLSYYRLKEELPLTLDGFVRMLAGSEAIGSIVVEATEMDKSSNDSEPVQYKDRSAFIASDFEEILLAIQDRELRCRFIKEVLPIMYGNLIRYYGDEVSSKLFLSEIGRPNLHDALYAR